MEKTAIKLEDVSEIKRKEKESKLVLLQRVHLIGTELEKKNSFRVRNPFNWPLKKAIKLAIKRKERPLNWTKYNILRGSIKLDKVREKNRN